MPYCRVFGRIFGRVLGLLLAMLVCPLAAATPQHQAIPGGIAVLPLGASRLAPEVFWSGHRLAVIDTPQGWQALLGIPLEQPPGPLEITVQRPNGPQTIPLTVAEHRYPNQHLRIRDQRKVEPNDDDLRRISEEQALTDGLKAKFSERAPATDFRLPADGPRSSRFGLRRWFNDQPRKPHGGLDIAVGTGAPVVAPAEGTILATGDFFFNGQTVFIDHGQGLITAYMHLSQITVRSGQNIRQGQTLGRAGATGRATGAHLHWAVFLNATAVNPELFLPPRQR